MITALASSRCLRRAALLVSGAVLTAGCSAGSSANTLDSARSKGTLRVALTLGQGRADAALVSKFRTRAFLRLVAHYMPGPVDGAGEDGPQEPKRWERAS
ncbi:hypothetical protein [Streptomyces canus]|uniref:hypothetical protein n=1 Tax=Streptomyces TaxID=1883 RepID=UPI0036ED4AF6